VWYTGNQKNIYLLIVSVMLSTNSQKQYLKFSIQIYFIFIESVIYTIIHTFFSSSSLFSPSSPGGACSSALKRSENQEVTPSIQPLQTNQSIPSYLHLDTHVQHMKYHCRTNHNRNIKLSVKKPKIWWGKM
jgi:hypothetical protein